MTTSAVDVQDLERRVKDVYRQVALQPERTYHFDMGRPLAERLGYPSDLLDHVPTSVYGRLMPVCEDRTRRAVGAAESSGAPRVRGSRPAGR